MPLAVVHYTAPGHKLMVMESGNCIYIIDAHKVVCDRGESLLLAQVKLKSHMRFN